MGIVGTVVGAAKTIVGTGNRIAGAVKHEINGSDGKWKPKKVKKTHFKKARTL